MPNVVILGAGIQGLSVALALAHRNIASTVLEKKPHPAQGASHGNEGKIHLGFVYALDTTMETGREMLRGALSFSSLLDRWCGPQPWNAWKSAGFRYAVMSDSLVGATELENYYAGLQAQIPEVLSGLPIQASYFGSDLTWMWRKATDTIGSPTIDGIPAVGFDTEEISIDTRKFNLALVDSVNRRQDIILRCSTRSLSVARNGHGFRVDTNNNGYERTIRADIVINCTWADRTRLDAYAGLCDGNDPLSYRVKHRIIIQPASGTKSLVPITMVQGPYGDLVPFGDGTAYLSWYPECRTYFGTAPPVDEVTDPVLLADIGERSLRAMTDFFPALRDARILSCSPCTIVAKGIKEVDDPSSTLHRRTGTGPHRKGNWWSVDTGKLSLAPMHAETTANLIAEELGRK